jgi:rSAM/selenodomain-associated transferase 1
VPVKSDADGGCGIAVMAKASEPGRTKTRLVPPLHFEEAAAFNTAFLKDVSANLQAAACAAPIRGYMAFGPPGSESFFRETLPRDIGLIEAWYPNFGDCLFTAIAKLLAAGHSSAVVLNSDSPTLPTSLLIEAADVLAKPGDRVVIGPSCDGGYYLLGVKRAHRRLFEDVDWSTDRVKQQSIERARELGLEVHELPCWYDVDDLGALRMLHGELFGGRSFSAELTPYPALHSAAFMRCLVADFGLAERLGITAPLTAGQVDVNHQWAAAVRRLAPIEPSP